MPTFCRVCGLTATESPDETFYRGLCTIHRQEQATDGRRWTGSRLLAYAKPVRVEVRDGREYVVVKLPPKRRSRSP
jgi:hypothetical protein